MVNSIVEFMFEQQIQKDIFFVFYGGVAVLSMIACCYLLLRRANAIAPDITPPVRLRRCAAAFLAALALCHLWYLPTYFISSGDESKLIYLVCGLLDSLTVIPLAIGVLLAMLQDRRRPLWPASVIAAPLVVGVVWCIAAHSEALAPLFYAYFIAMFLGLVIYMIREVRRYGTWLRDNYADLEHKEVWQSFVVLIIILLTFGIYAYDIDGLAYEYMMEGIDVVLICYLLWRVETLSDLSVTANDAEEETVVTDSVEDNDLPSSVSTNIASLLKQHCEEAQLYLQYDITLSQLAKQIGTNRAYLSKHFALQGTTYNAYINGLRIRHFTNLYHKAVATHQIVTAQQLSYQSGFRSYNTFSVAFKKKMGMNTSEWMHNVAEQQRNPK